MELKNKEEMLKPYQNQEIVLDNFEESFFENTKYRDTRIIQLVDSIKRLNIKSLNFNSNIKTFTLSFKDLISFVKIKDDCNITFSIDENLCSELEEPFNQLLLYLFIADEDTQKDLLQNLILYFNLSDIEITQLKLVSWLFRFISLDTPIEFENIALQLHKNNILTQEDILNNQGLIKMFIYKLGILGYEVYKITENDTSETIKVLFTNYSAVSSSVEEIRETLKETLFELAKKKEDITEEIFLEQFSNAIDFTKDILTINLPTEQTTTVESVKYLEDNVIEIYRTYTDDIPSSFITALEKTLVNYADAEKYERFKQEQKGF